MRLEGKVALVTGGARGIGAAAARLFAREGAKVAICDLREEEGRRGEAEVKESGGTAVFVRLDVVDERDWVNAVETVVGRFGKLDVLVNNAGISDHSLVETTSVEEWDRMMAVNAKGVFLGTRTAIPEMRSAGGGSIINTSSQLGLVGVDTSSPQYQASKGAVRLLTKATAIQYAAEGIRVNSVHPGPIVTPLNEERYRAHPELVELSASRVPLGRRGQPEEVAYGMLYLASDESSFVTGSELIIDGGWTAQ